MINKSLSSLIKQTPCKRTPFSGISCLPCRGSGYEGLHCIVVLRRIDAVSPHQAGRNAISSASNEKKGG